MRYTGRLAHHEAGHAVLGICFGLQIDEISLETKESRLSGSVQFNLGYSEIVSQLPTWKVLSLIIAGSVAEVGYGGGYMKEIEFDKLNGSDESPGSDKARFIELSNSLPISSRQQTINQALQFTGSRLIRNWHHLQGLAENLKSKQKLSAADVQNWFNKATKYEKFNY